jgi:signal transduction histidine kinase/ActR/RegA family two-component response regulator
MTAVSASALIVAFVSLISAERSVRRQSVKEHLERTVLSVLPKAPPGAADLETVPGTPEILIPTNALIARLSALVQGSDHLATGLGPQLAGFCVYQADGIPVAYAFSTNVYEAGHRPSPLRFLPSVETVEVEGDILSYYHPWPAASMDQTGRRANAIEFVLRLDMTLGLRQQRGGQLLGAGIVLPLIAFLLSLLLSSRLEHLISRPITQLAQTMLRVTEVQDYSPRLRHQRNDEISDLVDGFNRMLAEIEKRDVALRQAQQLLEQKVVERTRDLRQEIGERRRAQKNLAQQLDRINLLNQITQAIANHQDVDSIHSVVLGELTERLPADFASVLLVDDEQQLLRVAGCRERELETAYLVWKVEKWVVSLAGSGWDQPDPEPVFAQGDLEQASSAWCRKPVELGMHSIAALPLLYERKLRGLLLLARRSTAGFSPGEREFLEALSKHVALAGHQARLYAELQTANQELRQTQQAVMQHERLRALGQMASGIAHDINNALSPVGGFAELLLVGETGLSETARRYLGHIKTASNDIGHIVARLREFYRGRAEQQPLVRVDAPKLLQEVIELTRPRWRDVAQRGGAQVDLRLDLAPDAPIVVGIETELREALTNLVLNAVDALPQGGTIILRTRIVRTVADGQAEAQPTHFLLEVEDTGTGMDTETRKRCLEPFFSTKGQRGTGLGLAMVYGTLQRHDGSIEIESEPGRGTIMRLVLPQRQPSAVLDDPARPDTNPLQQIRVLFVDDEPLLRELIRDILETDGHEVLTADGGAEALATFGQLQTEGRAPDVVITDLGMPKMDGRELTRQIKSRSPATPVIMMTGWGKMMRGQEDIRAPVDAIVSKPPRMAELQKALADVLRPG